MTCWVVIPIKANASGKSRLAEALDFRARETLVRTMLGHVVAAAQGARTVSRVLLLGPSRLGLSETLPLLHDPGRGLNAAVHSALEETSNDPQTPARLLVLFADLPEVTPGEIDLLAAAPRDAVAIAPDRHGTGTNALSLPLPVARGFRFGFGADSFARHKAECEHLGLRAETVWSPGLARDIDEPADLPGVQAAPDGH